MSFPKNVCLVLLIGVPGSGKSFFREFFENYLKTNHGSVLGKVKMYSVCYDDFYKVRNPIIFNEQGDSWKEERSEILKVVERIIVQLENRQTESFSKDFPNIHGLYLDIENPDGVLLVIDDNMFYRSMRYEYFKLAKKYNLGFCQIYFDISLKGALDHNNQRALQSRVPDVIIEIMLDKFEPPNKKNSWEMSAITILSPTYYGKYILCNIFAVIKSAMDNPAHPSLNNLFREESQQITNSNALHQIDITLKQLVSLSIKTQIKVGNVSPRALSQHYSNKRLNLLKEIRERRIVLPIDLSKPVNQEDIDLVKPVLFELLNSVLAL